MSIDDTIAATLEPAAELTHQAPETTAPVAEEGTRPKARSSKGFAKEEPIEETKPVTVIRFEDLELEEVNYEDMPCTLPHGFFIDGERLTTFEMNPFDPKVDSMLGSLYSGQKIDIKQILVKALPEVIKSVGGRTLQEIAQANGITVSTLIEQMPLGDALTKVIAYREACVGDEIAIDDSCPNCNTRALDNPDKGRYYHRTGDVKVGNIVDLSDRLVVEVTLEGGFELHGVNCKRIHMRPVRLYELSKMPTLERGKLDIAMVQLQISAIPECERVANVRGLLFNDKAYASMSGPIGLKDRNTLIQASAKLQKIGPAMSVENTCDNCGNVWNSNLSWANLRGFWYTPPMPLEK